VCCYILPGLIIADLILRGRTPIVITAIGTGVSICYHLLVGFFLAYFAILSTVNIMLVWMGTVCILLLVWVISRKYERIKDIRIGANNLSFYTIIIAAIILIFSSYFVWEGKAEGISAWDRSEHLVKLLYLLYHQTLPITEIGIDATAFYPQGYNLNAVLFVSFMNYFSPFTSYSLALTGFNAFNMSILIIPVYQVTYKVTGNQKAALLSIFCFIPGSYLLIFQSMPSTLAMILVGGILMLNIDGEQDRVDHCITIAFLFGIFLIHAVIFIYVVIAILSIALFNWKGLKRTLQGLTLDILRLSVGAVSALVMLYATAHALFWGTVSYGIVGTSSNGSIEPSISPGFLFSLLPTRWADFVFYGYAILPLIPALILGFFTLVREKKWGLLGLLLGSIYISVTAIARFDARVRFFMLYPVAIIGGIGLLCILEYCENFEVNAKFPRFSSRTFTSLIMALMMITIIVAPVANASLGFGSVTTNWNASARLDSYLDDEAYQIVNWMHDNDFANLGVIATPDDAVYFQVVEALTNNKILMASSWLLPESFPDMKTFFNVSSSNSTIYSIAEKYNITAYLIRGNYEDYHILAAYPLSETYNATDSYRLTILNPESI
jgi:hypothetical protein